MDSASWRNLFDIFEGTELNDLSKLNFFRFLANQKQQNPDDSGTGIGKCPGLSRSSYFSVFSINNHS